MTVGRSDGQGVRLAGMRTVLLPDDPRFPDALRVIPRPPKRLYVLGSPEALTEGLAVVGARKATPYGIGAAKRFARFAAQRGITVISGGARGCDAAAHEAALSEGAPTVAFLGGGCDVPYPREHAGLFERIALSGGAVVSEHAWDAPALPQQFRTRNRLIAGLARATLIVEAGLPSGTFSTADEALAAGRDVLVVPGAINSASSKGANRLLVQGAFPVVDDESFSDVLFSVFGCLKMQDADELSGKGSQAGSVGSRGARSASRVAADPITAALQAEPLGMEQLFELASEHCGKRDARAWLMERLAVGEQAGSFARYPDGRWGPRA